MSRKRRGSGKLLILSSLMSLRFGTVLPSVGLAVVFFIPAVKMVWARSAQGLSVPSFITFQVFYTCYSLAFLALSMIKPCQMTPGSLPSKSFFSLVPWAKLAEEPRALGTWMLSLSSFPILGKTLLVSLFEYLPQSSLGDLRPPISPLLHPWWFLK